jgi:hypothetical protein
MLRATVSGSFRRHMTAVYDAVSVLMEQRVEVLSPADPRIVDQIGEFVFVASDRVRSIKMVQDRHLECIRASDFLWLVTPDGYVGQSASMEVGFAVAHGIPVFSDHVPSDGTLQRYVQHVADLATAISVVVSSGRAVRREHSFLIHPIDTIDHIQERLELLKKTFLMPPVEIREEGGRAILEETQALSRILSASSPRGGKVSVA